MLLLDNAQKIRSVCVCAFSSPRTENDSSYSGSDAISSFRHVCFGPLRRDFSVVFYFLFEVVPKRKWLLTSALESSLVAESDSELSDRYRLRVRSRRDFIFRLVRFEFELLVRELSGLGLLVGALELNDWRARSNVWGSGASATFSIRDSALTTWSITDATWHPRAPRRLANLTNC